MAVATWSSAVSQWRIQAGSRESHRSWRRSSSGGPPARPRSPVVIMSWWSTVAARTALAAPRCAPASPTIHPPFATCVHADLAHHVSVPTRKKPAISRVVCGWKIAGKHRGFSRDPNPRSAGLWFAHKPPRLWMPANRSTGVEYTLTYWVKK